MTIKKRPRRFFVYFKHSPYNRRQNPENSADSRPRSDERRMLDAEAEAFSAVVFQITVSDSASLAKYIFRAHRLSRSTSSLIIKIACSNTLISGDFTSTILLVIPLPK
jgi:hypothetical protein